MCPAPVRPVDVRREKLQHGVSEHLLRAIEARLQRGERVLSRREAAGYGSTAAPAVNVTINARDAESFRQSRTQVAADIARAVSLGRRGM